MSDDNIEGGTEAEELANQILSLEKEITEMENTQDVKASLPYYLDLLQKRYGNETNVLKEQAIALVALSNEPERLKQMIADLQGIGGDSLEMRQLHALTDENEKYHQETDIKIEQLVAEIKEIERNHVDYKIDIKRNKWQIFSLAGLFMAYIIGRQLIPIDELTGVIRGMLEFLFGG